MQSNIEKTMQYVKEQFDKSSYFATREQEKLYRYEHSIRCANIGKIIAEKEGLNSEALIIGCLLHDISYVMDFESHEDILNHGRYSALIASVFLETLDLDEDLVKQILYGIAIHVDGKATYADGNADFEGENTPLALSITDCDSIDRYDVYRTYETLLFNNYKDMSIDEKYKFLCKFISDLNKRFDQTVYPCGTNTGKEMWYANIRKRIQFYEDLKHQVEISRSVL